MADPLDIQAGGAPGSEVYAWSGSSTQKITIDDEYTEELVDYVVARANLSDSKYADPGRAQVHTQRFLQSINARMLALTGTNPNLTTLPGVSAPGAAA